MGLEVSFEGVHSTAGSNVGCVVSSKCVVQFGKSAVAPPVSEISKVRWGGADDWTFFSPHLMYRSIPQL